MTSQKILPFFDPILPLLFEGDIFKWWMSGVKSIFDPLTNYFLHSFVSERCRILLLIHFLFGSEHLLTIIFRSSTEKDRLQYGLINLHQTRNAPFEMDQKRINVFKKSIEFHRIPKVSEILDFIRVNVHFKPCCYQVSFRVGADRFPASNIPS